MAAFSMGTTSGTNVPIEHLDYDYVSKCNNATEVEKILKVLRSSHIVLHIYCSVATRRSYRCVHEHNGVSYQLVFLHVYMLSLVRFFSQDWLWYIS